MSIAGGYDTFMEMQTYKVEKCFVEYVVERNRKVLRVDECFLSSVLHHLNDWIVLELEISR
jgi:hypothetical protein